MFDTSLYILYTGELDYQERCSVAVTVLQC